MKNKILLLVYYVLFMIYMETCFSYTLFGVIDLNILTVILFSIPIGIVLYLISSLANIRVNRIITYTIIVLITFIFGAQVVYFKIYDSIISFFSITGGGQVFQFMDMIIKTIFNNGLSIILMLLPLIVLIILDIKKIITYESFNYKKLGLNFVMFIVLQAGSIMVVNVLPNSDLYSLKNLYYNIHAPVLTSKKIGLVTMMRLDLQRLIFGFTENINVETETSPIIEEEETYNMLSIDFDKLINEEKNATIKSIHEYISKQTPSMTNQYTGKFKGKNLVVFVAEAFSELAIDKKLTPTLYKLKYEGFNFKNFYTPIFPVSTSDGEYITDTSLIPKEGVWSMYVARDNYFPYSYANVFKSQDYTTNSYHNHYASYYHRDKFLLGAMNYDSYKACGRNLNINCNIWPESDLEMIKASTSDYINNDSFLAYYMTVSGHLNYTRSGNMMVSKNWSLVKDLPYSEKPKGYIAANIELDRAVAELIKRLEETGKLDDTVIVISSDHYPYGLTLDEINEISTYKRDDVFEKYRMPLLIWNNGMEPVEVDNYGSSLDVLPTVLNLFGVSYDSRLLMGRDILSNSDPLIIFSNRSFITDKGKYNAVTHKFESFGEKVSDEYITNMSNIVYNKFKMSRLIIENDYYAKLKGLLGD